MMHTEAQEALYSTEQVWNIHNPVFCSGTPRYMGVECGDLIGLQPKQKLFRVEQEKDQFFRIEAGVILLSTPAPDGSLLETGLAYGGEFIGLGFLSRHICSATAVTACTISCYPISEFDRVSYFFPDLIKLRDDAVRTEFESLRHATVVQAHCQSMTVRVARFLLVASSLAESEGRNPNLSSDMLQLSRIGALLNIDARSLLQAIQELESHNLVCRSAEFVIRSVDPMGLDVFASVASGSHEYRAWPTEASL